MGGGPILRDYENTMEERMEWDHEKIMGERTMRGKRDMRNSVIMRKNSCLWMRVKTICVGKVMEN